MKSHSVLDQSTKGVALVVDDSQLVKTVVAKSVESLGYAVYAFECCREALAWIGSYDGHLDLLVTDMTMPWMSGGELAVRVKQVFPDVRCLFMSGNNYETMLERGLLAPDDAFVSKPFSQAELKRMILFAVGRV
ncbi:MAG: response regulator [Acidobacteria bacterium]|nr:response regulator [Acidobacteriota bacterium]